MAIYTLKQYKQMKKAKVVPMSDKEFMINNLLASLRAGLITYGDFLRLYLQIKDDNE